MFSNAAISGVLSPMTATMNAFSGLSTSVFNVSGDGDTQASAGLGVSTASGPLISAPAARQASEFQAAIAPPTRPTNSALAPPNRGGDDLFGGDMSEMDISAEAMGFIAALKSEMAGTQPTIR